MSITFDPTNKRIILDSAYVSAAQLYSRWKEWAKTGENLKYDQAFYALGGDPLGGGLFVASYFFLMNGWRIRPMESNHLLIIDGNIGVYGGGSQPVVQTLGSYNVSVQYTVPVQAQGVATNGGGSDISAIAAALEQIIANRTMSANLTQIKGKDLNLMTENGWE